MWDCVVVGGGAAGQSAALVLGRARRRTLLVDAGRPSNLPAGAVGGLLWHEGRAPAELYAIGRAQLAALPSVEVRAGEVVDGLRADGAFTLELAGGGRERTRRVLLATGMDYVAPDLPGLAPLWGGAVFHCPFCHGWEVRGRPLAVLAPAPRLVHAALLLTMWSDDVVALTGGAGDVPPEDRARLEAAGVPLDGRPVARLRADGRRLRAVVFADGATLARDGLMVATDMRPRAGLAARLGAALAAGDGHGPAGAVRVDARQRTDVPGLFAAGDAGGGMQQVTAAVASGALAGAMIVQSLLAERHGLPG